MMGKLEKWITQSSDTELIPEPDPVSTPKPENRIILDPEAAIRVFDACKSTKELWEATCRVEPGDWSSDVFAGVWDVYAAIEDRLVEQGHPRVSHYFPKNKEG
ncbi:MAG: hypothetical protein ACYCRD_06555 [Leptospirillum sp.]